MSESYYFECSVSGESFQNDDGSSRQEEIALCRAGEPIALRWDRNNAHDSNAVAVHSIRGTQIGFVSKADNTEILSAVAEGRLINASIDRVHGGSAAKPKRGVVLSVEMLWDEPEEEPEGVTIDESEEDTIWCGRLGFWLITHP